MRERPSQYGIAAGAGLSVLLHGMAVAAIVYYGLGARDGPRDPVPMPIALVIEENDDAPVVAPIVQQSPAIAVAPPTTPALPRPPVAPPAKSLEPRPTPAPVPPRAKREMVAALPAPATDPGLAAVETPAAALGVGEASSADRAAAIAALGGTASGAARPAGPPKLVHAPAPEYPSIARRRAQQGRVVLAVEVDADGRTIEASVLSGSGHAALDEAALRTVKEWRFDKSSETKRKVEVPVVFRLGD